MKKRIFSLMITAIVFVAFCLGSFNASASIYYVDGQPIHCPGNTRAYLPLSEYNYAWIDYVSIRDSSSSVTALELRPVTDMYSHTYAEFVKECCDYTSLFSVSDKVLEDTFTDSLKSVYYSLLATGLINNDYQSMRAYNESMGIVYPYAESTMTEMYTAIVYVCLRSDLHTLLTDQDVYIPRGTTVEGAVVAYMSTICGMEVPASVNTIAGFSYIFARDNVIEDEGYPVSKDPNEEEVFYWTMVKAADRCGYAVPKTTPYSEVTQSQREYVMYAYYASILTTKYDVMVDPYQLKDALALGGNAVPVLVLKSMLDDVSVSYASGESGESLYEKAKKEGFFDLENQFYSDIYEYELTVGSNYDKIWITSFLIANSLERGSISNAKTYVNSKLVPNTSTVGIDLNSSTDTVFTVKITYDDASHHDAAEYKFTVKRGATSITESGVSVDVEEVVNGSSVGFDGNIMANYVFQDFDLPSYSKPTQPSVSGASSGDNTITTYPVGNSSDTTSYSSVSYFTTYAPDETAASVGDFNLTNNEEPTTQTLLNGVIAVAKENPAAVATPFGLLAIGASAGYVFFKKRKEDINVKDNETEDR